jgi:hypothetical protein
MFLIHEILSKNILHTIGFTPNPIVKRVGTTTYLGDEGAGCIVTEVELDGGGA